MSLEQPSAYEKLPPEAAARIDAVCDRFEMAWQAARSGAKAPCLADYLDGSAGPERAVLVDELIALDRACLQRYGTVAPPDELHEIQGTDEDTAPTRHGPAGPGILGPRAAHWPSIAALELVEVLGSGGMGVVFKARQTTLDREVAVKFLRDVHVADAEQRERFVQEARAVARLQHPSLVQLYEFGEVPGVDGPDSQPYLVLEYVSGGSLAQRLRGSCLEPLAAARLVETLAEAIHFAHQQGVIHRDLKPANVLLAPKPTSEARASRQTLGPQRGAAQTQTRSTAAPAAPAAEVLASSGNAISDFSPKVTDFGLAKFVAGGSLTKTGDVLGTPCYMAPEQTTGKAGAITPAVDVYGLGAILYEALTGRPPFEAETQVATVRQVQEDDPVPPRRLRPVVPRDLETICLKCLRKEPGRRYASAQELADDLRRFALGEPIRARPVRTAERVLRWCRCRPLVASLLAALAIVFVAGVCGVSWQWQQARQRELETQREHERAEENLKKLREKIDRLSDLGQKLATEPRLRQTALALLDEALDFYRDILLDGGSDPRLRQEAARMYGAVAYAYHSTGKWHQAVDAYRREAELLSVLAKDEPANKQHSRRLAVSYRSRGNVLRDLGETQQARASYRQAVEVAERLLDESPDDPALQVALANTLDNLATVLSKDEADHVELYRRIIALCRAAVNTDGKRDVYRMDLALGLEGLGLRLLARGKVEEATAPIDEALAILVLLPRRDGDIERYVARTYVSRAKAQFAAGQVLAAEQSYDKALELLTPAVVEKLPFNRIELARTLMSRADFLKEIGREKEVEPTLRQAIEQYRILQDSVPDDKGNLVNLAQSYLVLAKWHWAKGRPDDAAEPYRLAFVVAPDDPTVNNELAWFLATNAEPRLWKPAEAVRLAQKAVNAKPKVGDYWNTLGVAHYRNGDDKAAIATLTTSMDLRAGGDSFDWFFLAMAHRRLGDRDQARIWYDKAVGWMDKQMPHNGELRRFRAEAEAMLAKAGKA